MPHRLYQDFIRAALTDETSQVTPAIRKNGVSAQERFSVYRNNMFSNLTSCLASTFPAVEALVGREFFRFAAEKFIRLQLPAQASLIYYGADFPNFLFDLPEASHIPYLSDLARLEWSLHDVYHAADDEPIKAAMLDQSIHSGDIPPIRLRNAVRLFHSDYAIEAIWAFAKANGEGNPPELKKITQNILIYRKGWQVVRRHLSRAEYVFLLGIVMLRDVGQCAAMAESEDPDFILSATLQFLLAEQILLKIDD